MPLAQKTKKKPVPTPAHHKKRVAGHHKKNSHYVKTYWPYLPMLFVVGLGMIANSVWGGSHSVLGASSDYSSQALLDDTNTQRAAAHELGLTIDTELTEAAQAKAVDMVQRNYWSHNTPDGLAPWTFIAKAGYSYEKAGENLAYGFDNADETITGWMNSPEHKANILNTGYKNVGFGVVSAPHFQGKEGAIVVVAMYGAPADAGANISFSVPQTTANTPVKLNDKEPAARLVSRVQTLSSGEAAWTTLVLSVIAVMALTLFLIRHGYRLHRLVTKGEHFVMKHPLLDIGFIAIATVGFVLTRTSGIIR
ncbi:MAG: hypothetical protein JWM81_990 [Candidatus Saccharibacteria bacterium]|nr:hypothetical protein [Candidatus Saccharibacteria bacterium]